MPKLFGIELGNHPIRRFNSWRRGWDTKYVKKSYIAMQNNYASKNRKRRMRAIKWYDRHEDIVDYFLS